jgi:hypothetical protein
MKGRSKRREVYLFIYLFVLSSVGELVVFGFEEEKKNNREVMRENGNRLVLEENYEGDE